MLMKLVIRWRPLVLWGLMLLGLALRLYGLNWDQGNSFHPDERQILFQVIKIAWPTSFAQFRDPVNSPLNPHFFAYGTLPIYLLALVGNVLSHFFPTLGSFANLTLVGRVLSALFDSGTIVMTGYLALLLTKDTAPGRPHAWNVALLTAALVAFTPFQLQLSHFYAVDTMLLFFVEFTILASVVLVNTERLLLWSVLAGLGYGLAVGTKFSAAPLAIPIVVALILRWYQRRDLFSAAFTLLSIALVTIIAFLIVEPYALLDMSNFIQQVADQGSLARGTLDLPYVRQFAGTIPFVYEAQNMLLWGLGLMLGLAAFAGLLWLLWRVWKRDAALWLVVLSWVVVYGAIMCSFYVKFMRYMLPIYPFLTLIAASFLLALLRREWRFEQSGNTAVRVLVKILRYCVIIVPLGGTLFQGLALLNIYSQPNTRIQASSWIYNNLKPGSVLTYEQWDDPLPVSVAGHDPSIYVQATYTDSSTGQATTGLDLYSDDTLQKAQTLAQLLPTIDAITMPTERLSKSIPRLPARYPLTIHYYQLLFSGQLGFHLAAQFENHPNLFGITLNDSGADESYWVFDHPTARIFVRDNPYPYTSAQLLQKLTDGIQLPAPDAQLSGDQRSLMLTPQQIADDQQSPSFGVQFPLDSLANKLPVLFWWLALCILGLLVYPLLFFPFRALPDRGYIFSKLFGVLLLAYLSWLLASTHLLAFSSGSLWLGVGILLLCGGAGFLWQRHAITAFLRQHWRMLLVAEGLFTLAFLLFVVIRAFNPDLWNIYRGGEKPMELAFLNAILRSSYMPPYDPWLAGGYINYYYYGYVIVASLIKLTGIVPTTAFNLAIPTLFAWTFCGAVIIVYSFSRRFPVALLGGYFAALIGNFNGVAQLKGQLQALLARIPIPAFDYWQSSRVIPFTINEFPFWSFLFADMHPHVMDMPVAVFMLGIIATFLLSHQQQPGSSPTFLKRLPLYLFAAFIFGTIACINPWDMPVYALLLVVTLGILAFQEKRQGPKSELFLALVLRLLLVVGLCAVGYLFYLPFYVSYQQLFVNGVGRVVQGSGQGDYLTIFGLWLFIALSFFLTEFYRRWLGARFARYDAGSWAVGIYILLSVMLVIILTLISIKVLLGALLIFGVFLFILLLRAHLSPFTASSPADALTSTDEPDLSAHTHPLLDIQDGAQVYTYLLLIMGLCIGLGIELVYIRDFLDGGDYERMNTVFKFSMQAWLCFALAGALAVHRLWRTLSGFVRQLWMVTLTVFVLGCSIFLVQGTSARINDRLLWQELGTPEVKAGSLAVTNYTPTLDGLAFARMWYPGDAEAIDWLNEHVSGSPVILEAVSSQSYQWFNRVSVFTGLPDVLGWSDHESEQRDSAQLGNRFADISAIYSTYDATQALTLLRSYSVRYVYVGALERSTYTVLSLSKFDHMAVLHVVYRTNGVTIYEVE